MPRSTDLAEEPKLPEAGTRPIGTSVTRWLGRPAPAAWTFGVFVIAAVVYYVWIGRDRWFFLDEWTLLGQFVDTSASGPLTPHNGHLIAVPWLIFRGLFQAFGISSYAPYLAVSVAFHAATAVLTRQVLRRAGVRPWVASLFAATLVLYGPGNSNVLVSFQVTMTGALAFGMAQLLLADHDGTDRVRDSIALACGVLGLMCSGVSLSMVVVVGVALFLRRGARPALLQCIPLIVMFTAWWLVLGRSSTPFGLDSVSMLPVWLAGTWKEALLAVSVVLPLAAVLAGATAGGYAYSWRGRTWSDIRHSDGIPLAFVVGLVAFATTTYVSRVALGPDAFASSRYLYVYLVLILPVVAPAVDRLALRFRAAAALFAIPIVAIGWNATQGEEWPPPQAFASHERRTQALLEAPELDQAPGDRVPDPLGHFDITAAWLRAVRDRGAFPGWTTPPDAEFRALAHLMYAVELRDDLAIPGDCSVQEGTRRATVRLPSGAVVGFRSVDGDPMSLLLRPEGAAVAAVYPTESASTLANVSDAPVTTTLQPDDRRSWMLCR